MKMLKVLHIEVLYNMYDCIIISVAQLYRQYLIASNTTDTLLDIFPYY